MVTDYQKIRNAIENYFYCSGGVKRFIIYPFGEYGMLTKKILNESFGVQEAYIVDNRLSKFNSNIKSLDFFKNKDVSEYIVLLTNANPDVHEEIRKTLTNVFANENIIDIFPLEVKEKTKQYITKCGKYSYGPLCNHWLVESVGSFSSIAAGADVLENHATQYISTHPFMYHDKEINDVFHEKYEECYSAPWYFPGIKPKGKALKLNRIKIGNDVWIGKNVLIVNGANVGDGVIAAAGTVILKDVPDYAVVAGVPARIVKYRFTLDQIIQLKKIAWWDWEDEKIRECYNDFFGEIDVFISKHIYDN